MIAEAWKDESAWFENTDGVQPVNNEILVDVTIDGETTKGDRAGSWSWDLDDEYRITHWRLHTPLDTILPKPTRPAPAMPHVKPSKQEKAATKVSTKVGRLRDKDILATFNKLTGCDLSEDHYKTLLSLQEMFDMRDDICF